MYYHRTTLYRILDSFLRHKWVFVITVTAILMMVFAYTLFKPTTYTATYTVLVGARQVQSPLGSQTEDPWTVMNRIVGEMSAMVSTKGFIQAALTLPDGHPVPLNHYVNLNNDSELLGIGHNISIENSDASKFTVTLANYPDADDTKVILAGIINEYIRRDAQARAAYYTHQKVFIADQVNSYHQKLTDAEKAITNFKTAKIGHQAGQEESKEQQLISLNGQDADLTIQIAAASDRIKYSQEQLSRTPKTVVSLVTNTPTESPFKSRLASLQQQLAEARITMSDNHPVVVDIKSRIQAVQQLIEQDSKRGSTPTTNSEPNPLYQSLNNQYVETQIDLKTLQRQQSEVEKQISGVRVDVAQIPSADKEQAEIGRDYTILTSTYATLKNQLQVATLNEEINLRNETDLYQTLLTMPPISSASGKKLAAVYVGGLFLALFLGAAIVMLVEWTDRSFRDPSEAERVLNIPVLAILPEIEAPKGPVDVTRRLLPTPDSGPGAAKPQKLLNQPLPAGASAVSAATTLHAENGRKRAGWSPFRAPGDNQSEDLGS